MIGGVSGALAAGLSAGLSPVGVEGAAQVAGQGVVGGTTNVAMGGKFQDGFLSSAAGASAGMIPFANNDLAGLIKSSIVGGTASALGGGKFSNGASAAAFQYLVTKRLSSEENDGRVLSNVGNEDSRQVYFGGSKDAPGHFWAAITQQDGTIMKYDFGVAGYGGLPEGISGKIQAAIMSIYTAGKVEYKSVSTERWNATLEDSKLRIYKFNIEKDIAIKADLEFKSQSMKPPSYLLLNANCSHRSLAPFGIIGSASPVPNKQIEYIGKFQ